MPHANSAKSRNAARHMGGSFAPPVGLSGPVIASPAMLTTLLLASTLILSSEGPKLRVTVDGKATGKFTSKSVTVADLAEGKHDVEITWVDAQLRKKTVYKGKLAVAKDVEMRIRVTAEGIQITDQVALVTTPPAPVGAPVKDFSNAPSILHITSEKMMSMVLIDGTPLQQGDCTSPKACNVMDLTPGNHEIDVRGGAFGNKPIFKGIVQITGGAEIYAKAADNQFTIYNTQARALPQQNTTTTTVITHAAPAPQPAPMHGGEGVSIGMSFIDPATGEAVTMNMSAGASGGSAHVSNHAASSVTTGTTTTTTTVAAGPGSLEFTSEDGESFQVFVDGKRVAQFMGLDGQSVTVKNVTAGRHKLVIKDFMGDEVWSEGYFIMEGGTYKFGVGEKSGLEAFSHPNAWQAGNRSR